MKIFLMILTAIICVGLSGEALAKSIKQYPANADQIFNSACAGFSKELLPYCNCISKSMKRVIPFNQLQKISKQKNPMNDSRIIGIANSCINARRR